MRKEHPNITLKDKMPDKRRVENESLISKNRQ